MKTRRFAVFAAVAAVCALLAAAPSLVKSQSAPVVVINLTSGAEDLHSAWMGLSLARMSLEEKRDVVVFLNVRGPVFASRSKGARLAYRQHPRLSATLTGLAGRGARVLVCPLCARELGITEKDLIPGASFATKQSLFSKLGENTVVFSY
jgi:predicted peroxiredoxin